MASALKENIGLILTIFITLILFFAGFMTQYAINSKNECLMTYSRPNYYNINLTKSSNSVSAKHYKLYRYMNNKKNPSSKAHICPFLFIPGHLGSYLQVRSLGSHSAGLKSNKCTFQFYSLDFKEEPTALSAVYLWRQAQVVYDALLSMEEDLEGLVGKGRKVGKATLVGHSYGGLVARAALSLVPSTNQLVGQVVTLGTPHHRPVWVHDGTISKFYQHLSKARRPPHRPVYQGKINIQNASNPSLEANDSLTDSKDKANQTAMEHLPENSSSEPTQKGDKEIEGSSNTTLAQVEVTGSGEVEKDSISIPVLPDEAHEMEPLALEVPILSLCGGAKDLSVFKEFCRVEPMVPKGLGLTISFEEIQTARVSADHKALLWCKQPLAALTSALANALPSPGLSEKGDNGTAFLESIKNDLVGSKSTPPKTMAALEDDLGRIGLAVVLEIANGAGLLLGVWVAIVILILAWALVLAPTLDQDELEQTGRAAEVKPGVFPPIMRCLLPQHHLGLKYIRRLFAGFTWRGLLMIIGLLVTLFALPVLGDLLAVQLNRFEFIPMAVVSGLHALLSFPDVIMGYLKLGMADLGIQLHEVNPYLPMSAPFALGIIYCLAITLMGTFLLLCRLVGVILVWFREHGPLAKSVSKIFKLWRKFRRWVRHGKKQRKLLPRFLDSIYLKQFLGVLALIPLHIRSFQPLTFQFPSLLTEIALAHLVALLALVVGLVALCHPPEKAQDYSFRAFLLLFYLPVLPLAVGSGLRSAEIFWRGGMSSVVIQHLSPLQATLFDLVVLVPIIGILWRQVLLSIGYPVAIRSLDQFQKTLYRTGVIETLDVTTHENCRSCLHEDGGSNALFVKNSNTNALSEVTPGYVIGPTFRVVECQCPRFVKDPREWCDFCACRCEKCDASITGPTFDAFNNGLQADEEGLFIVQDLAFSMMLCIGSSSVICIPSVQSHACIYLISLISLIILYFQLSRNI